MDVKTALREEQINPTVSLKTHAQPVRYSDAFVFICHLTVTQCRAAELVDFFLFIGFFIFEFGVRDSFCL